MQKLDNIQRLHDVTLARCFAALSLVVWHTYCIYICWGDCVNSPFDSFYSMLFRYIIPDANMPLFTFIAGYLFMYQFSSKKYSNGKEFFKSKVHRLLIPYFILGTIASLLQYGYWEKYIEILYGKPNHLWFCLMIFYCYIVCWSLESRSLRWVNIGFAILSLGIISHYENVWSFANAYHLLSGIEIAAYYYFFFFLGFVCFNYRSILFSNWKMLLVYLLFYVLVKNSVLRVVDYIFLIMTFSNIISQRLIRNENIWKCIEKVSMCTFGIYVIHHIVLWDLSQYPPMADIVVPIMETHYIVAPIILCVGVFAFCFGLADLLLKTRIGRYLFL